MDEAVARKLVALNAEFYERFAGPFSASRAAPQPGYERLVPYIPADGAAILDVGCGNGRFGRFVGARGIRADYTGVDFSKQLLSNAEILSGQFLQRDLSLPDCLAGLGDFDLIVSLSTLQHIPGRANRERLLREMADHIRPGGRIILANWQFLGSPRQRRKIRPWSEAGLRETDVEPGDFLLSWRRGGFGLRYVALLDEAAIHDLARFTDFRVAKQFCSDGREGNLNLYTILALGQLTPPRPMLQSGGSAG